MISRVKTKRSTFVCHRCLEAVIKGCGTAFNVHIDQELLDLIFHSLNHTNRFVRETGYYVCGALVSCNTGSSGEPFGASLHNSSHLHLDRAIYCQHHKIKLDFPVCRCGRVSIYGDRRQCNLSLRITVCCAACSRIG